MTERASRRLAAVNLTAAVVVAALCALGVWQLQRRAWKLDLIHRVETRVHAPPVAPPPKDRWPDIDAARDEYRHVRVEGAFLPVRPALVQAVTELGGGFWVIAPLRMADGAVVLINRGFVPSDRRAEILAATSPPGSTEITGLLRLSEPGGGFLRTNDPASDRWFSRDVVAIATARNLTDVAPFFIDADRTAEAPGAPAGGLTVLHFANNHLLYAMTWFAMALLLAGAVIHLNFRRRRNDRSPEPDP